MSGWVVPEEAVFNSLTAGLADVRARIIAATVDEFLLRVYANLTSAQRTELKTWLTANELLVIHGYPRQDAELPLWAIILDPEENVFQYSGDAIGGELLGTGENVIAYGERWSSTIGIITHTEHMDLTRWLYQLCKFIMSRDRVNLADIFRHGQRLAGRDLQPQELGGRLAYRRVLSLRAEYDQVDAGRDDVAEQIDDTGTITTGQTSTGSGETFNNGG